MGARLRFWLQGLLVGLFALAVLPAPAENARAVIERAAFAAAYAMPDGTLPVLCDDHHADAPVGHGGHFASPACDACVLMAAPGLADQPFAPAGRRAAPVARDLHSPAAVGLAGHAWAPSRARAPPAILPA